MEAYFHREAPVGLEQPVTLLTDPEHGLRRAALGPLGRGRIENGTGTVGAAWTAADARALARSYPTPPEIHEAPYWGKGIPYATRTVRSGDRVFVATSLLYPIVAYDEAGAPGDSIVDPPRSWREPRVPRSGEFANVGEGAAERARARDEYVRDLTVITGLAAVADSVLVVSHGTYAPGEDGVLEARSAVCDIRIRGARVASDLPCPGEIVAWGHSSVFFWRRPAPAD